MSSNITFKPTGIRGEIKDGESALDTARRLGVYIESTCGGQMVCGKCRVRPVEGEYNEPAPEETGLLSPEELSGGLRLACALYPCGDAVVSIPEESQPVRQVVLGGDPSRVFEVDPDVRKYYVELVPPALGDPASDLARLYAGLEKVYGLVGLRMAYPVMKALSRTLRDGGWKVTATIRRGGEIIRLQPGYAPGVYGAAFDVGTTTIAGMLVDMESGATLATSDMTNPQIAFGEDVISRITYAAREGGADELRRVLMDGLNGMLDTMMAKVGLKSQNDVAEVIVVGNTVMHHLIYGLPVVNIGVSPFVPALSRAYECKADSLGLNMNGCGYALSLPIAGGFVGADNTAALIACGPYDEDERLLIVDVGTNGEIALLWRGRVMTASCATGPAFEGAQVSSGMRAAPGAVDRVVIDPDSLDASYAVIGRQGWSGPVTHTGVMGICGSGVVDAVAQLLSAGIIDKEGTFVKGIEHARVKYDGKDGPEYVVAWAGETFTGNDLTITQGDVRAVQLAKAALYAGARVLMSEMGVERLDRVLLAGAFGSFIDVRNALAIGMFPDCAHKDVHAVGNAAGDGAKAALLSFAKRDEADAVSRKVEYVELSVHPAFQGLFMGAMGFNAG